MEYTHQAAATAGSDWWNAEATTPAAARARESLRHTVRRTSVAAAPLYVIGIKPLMAQMKALIESFQPMCLDRPSDHASRQRNAGRLRTVDREVRDF